MLVGDFNLLALGEGRYSVSAGELVSEAAVEQATLSDALASCIDVRAAGYSRRQFRGGMPHLVSRLDRAFICGASAPYPGDVCIVRYLSSPSCTTYPSVGSSDHAPWRCVCVSIGKRALLSHREMCV